MFIGLARVLLFYVVSVLIFATTAGFTKGFHYSDHVSLLISTLFTFLLVALFVKWEKLSLLIVGIDFKPNSILRFLSGFGIGMLMVAIQAIVTASFAEVTFVLSSDVSISSIIYSLALYLLVALREELVFRSYTLRSLAIAMTPPVALSIITIIFILEHVLAGVSWKMSIIGSGFGGILFGLAALKTKGLALPLGIHSSWNFSQWMLGFKNDTGIWKEAVKTGEELKAENVALTGFVIAMSIAILYILISYNNNREVSSDNENLN